MNKVSVAILAAGEGTRMKSECSKVLHNLSGKPLVRWVLSAVAGLKPEKVFMIVGHRAEQVKTALAEEKLSFVEQSERLGSGHALKQVEKFLKNFVGDVVVLCADTPLIKTATLNELLKYHKKSGNSATVLSSNFENPYSYGRIVRAQNGQVLGIVEEKDATPEQKQIKEINSGIYCFKSPLIWKVLKQIKANNNKKEYYLTDAISILNQMGEKVGAFCNVQSEEIMGVNNRLDLSVAEKIVRLTVLKNLMLNGVTIMDPENTYISADAVISNDTTIYPGTIIEGKVKIGSNCSIGPFSFIKDTVIGNHADIKNSYIVSSKIGDKVKIGPFAHLRPGTDLKNGVRVGNFSEVKNSTINFGAKVNHLSYIGDSIVGVDVNIGAGTITCNYDGVQKHKTIIGDRAFIGSNVNLVAPVKVGSDVVLGAGSTITDDVPSKSLAIARARQINKPRKNNLSNLR